METANRQETTTTSLQNQVHYDHTTSDHQQPNDPQSPTSKRNKTPIVDDAQKSKSTTKQPKKIISKMEAIYLREQKQKEKAAAAAAAAKLKAGEAATDGAAAAAAATATDATVAPKPAPSRPLSKAELFFKKQQAAKQKAEAHATKLAEKEAKERAKVEKAAEREAKKAEKAAKALLPTKPKTAYFHFTAAKRGKFIEDNPDEAKKGVAAIAKLVGVAWGALTDEEKEPYYVMAAEDKERYTRECEAAGIEIPEPKSRRKAAADGDEGAAPKPKRAKKTREETSLAEQVAPPKTALECYRSADDIIAAVVAANPEASVPEVVAVMNEAFAQLSDEEKKPYEEMAAKETQRYEFELMTRKKAMVAAADEAAAAEAAVAAGEVKSAVDEEESEMTPAVEPEEETVKSEPTATKAVVDEAAKDVEMDEAAGED